MFVSDTDNDQGYEYAVTISNFNQFQLAIKLIGLGCSFCQVTHMYQVTNEELNCGYMGSLNLCKMISCARVLVVVSLQVIKELLNISWSYSVAFDTATPHNTSNLDKNLRLYINDRIMNIHVLALPMFEPHTGAYMHSIFDVLDQNLRKRSIGVITDGAANMTGRHKGVVLRFKKQHQKKDSIEFGVRCISLTLGFRCL